MQKQRLTHVLILFACGIGIGFALRAIERWNAPVSTIDTVVSSETGSHAADAMPGKADESTYETIKKLFVAVLKHSTEEEQRWVSRAVFANLGAGEMMPLAAKVEKLTVDESLTDDDMAQWIFCDEFYRRWGELAPLEALEFLKDSESYWGGIAASVWTGWTRTDPDAAVAAYDPKLEREYSSEIQDAVLDGLCAVDPAKALRFADVLGIGSDYNFAPENRDEIYDPFSSTWDLLEYVPVERPGDTFGLAIYSWIYRDQEGAFEEMRKLKNDTLRRASLNALFSNWILQDPNAAELALKKITDRGLRESTTHTAMQAYLFRHPREALGRIIQLPKYVAYVYADGSSIDPFAETAPSEKPEIVEIDEEDSEHTLPYRFCNHDPFMTSSSRMALISEAAASLAIREGKAAWDRAGEIENKHKRAAALGGALAGWLIFDLEQAASFAAAGIVNDSLIALGGADFPDFAAQLVSKNLAQDDFQQAIAWVEALPAGSLREAGIEAAVKTRLDQAQDLARKEASPDGWVDPKVVQEVQRREYAPVMEWLASLPPSKGRDSATYWLVFRLEDHDDPGIALKWAATIDDTRRRRLAFESLAREIFPKKKGDAESVDFDFEAWSDAHPVLAAEMKRELARKKNEKGDGDEE